MKVASLQFNPICENTYVVWDDTNECIVVDAGNSDERENARLKEFTTTISRLIPVFHKSNYWLDFTVVICICRFQINKIG